jgi:hypothetical protein
MQGRSWMAALTLVTAMAGGFASRALADEPNPIRRKVALTLKFEGLSPQGGEVEIKPGNAACRFESIKFQTKGHPRSSTDGRINLDPIDVETFSADRDCSFAITLKEPGLPEKKVRRILRITPTPDGKPAPPQLLTCFISSTSLNPPVARKEEETKRKK